MCYLKEDLGALSFCRHQRMVVISTVMRQVESRAPSDLLFDIFMKCLFQPGSSSVEEEDGCKHLWKEECYVSS